MLRRSSRLQAGSYYAMSNGLNSTPAAAISYYETPVRYVHLSGCVHIDVCFANCYPSKYICLILFPVGVPGSLGYEPPDRRVLRRPPLKASLIFRVMSGLCSAMQVLTISPRSSGLVPESQLTEPARRSRITEIFFDLKR